MDEDETAIERCASVSGRRAVAVERPALLDRSSLYPREDALDGLSEDTPIAHGCLPPRARPPEPPAVGS
jgi:hypothetical protein